MAKTTKAEAARRGTKADPARAEERRAEQSRKAKAANDEAARKAELKAQGRETWYVDALDPKNLSPREVTTRRLFTAAEVVLCLVIVISVMYVATAVESFDFDAIVVGVFGDVDNLLMILVGLLQVFAAYLVHQSYERYVVGDVGVVQYSVLAMLCGEIILQNYIGIVALAVLLWRVWQRSNKGLSTWQSETGFKEKMASLWMVALFVLLAVSLAIFDAYLS